MLAQLEQRLVQAEERALALSMGHLCTNADEEIRMAIDIIYEVRKELEGLEGQKVRELRRRTDVALVDLVCVQRKKTPSIAA